MAHIFRGQGSTIGRLLAPLLTLVCTVITNAPATAQLYDRPVLVVDPGMHTAEIFSGDVDAAGTRGVTGSQDKTVRVWRLTDGQLLQTIRMPAGPDQTGEITAVAMSPDGTLVAAGGYTGPDNQLYLFEAGTRTMVHRIEGLPGITLSLAFSLDGRYLAAGLLGAGGLRVYDRDRQWSEAFSDKGYGNGSDGIPSIAFAADGRLATASYDRNIRLYDRIDRKFKLVVPPREMTGGDWPFAIAFTHDGTKLAVGYGDGAQLDLLDGHSLRPLPPSLNVSDFRPVAWSKEGDTLYAGGGGGQILVWPNAGRGQRRALPVGAKTISRLATLPDGGILVATEDPLSLELLEPDGRPPRWRHPSPTADFRDQQDTLAVSADGTTIDFGFERLGKSPLRFDVRELRLSKERPADHPTSPARRTGLLIEGWRDGSSPKLDGNPIESWDGDLSRSLAIHPDGSRFVLGAHSSLQAFDAKGKRIWWRPVPNAQAVNISGDGRLVLATYRDGTIRWHRMDDGSELLALYVLADKQNWVAWTPEGFYESTSEASSMLKWHVNNRGSDAAADTVPVNDIPNTRRPDALKLVLQEMETARALGIDDVQAARQSVKTATGAPKPRLHVLTIGIGDYGDKAKNLTLKFAASDARDVRNALSEHNRDLLYDEVWRYPLLVNEHAGATKILQALDDMVRNVTRGGGRDLAVVMFSGHGFMVHDEFYLVPYGFDDSSDASRELSALKATLIQQRILELAKHGRVLVLLDACRSERLIGLPADKSGLVAENVTVLTSSEANQDSGENERWGHGAFTQVLLDALSGSSDVDTNRNGAISIEELTAYVGRQLPLLTDGKQKLGLAQRFYGDIFAAGR